MKTWNKVLGSELKPGMSGQFGMRVRIIERITREGRTIDKVFYPGGSIYCTDGFSITFFDDEYSDIITITQ
jgi:hypothetical protein